MQNKKKSEKKAGDKSNSIIRTRAYVYDLYSKCNNNERIVTNVMPSYHRCANNIMQVMRGKYCERITITKKDNRGWCWIGPAPDEKIIASIHKEITDVRGEYMKTYTSKPRSKTKTKQKAEPTKQTLEFVFDNDVSEVEQIPNPQKQSLQSMLDQMQELFKKFL